jgi:transcriptional regulator with XRE-family HTH domain
MARREFRHRVGTRIRNRRIDAGLTQWQLGLKCRDAVEGGQVGRWERGASFPNYDHVVALARALKVTEEELLASDDQAMRRAA